MGPDALADWHIDTHFLFAAHNLPNEACHSPSPPFNSSLADCHLMRFMDKQTDENSPTTTTTPAPEQTPTPHYYCNFNHNSWCL